MNTRFHPFFHFLLVVKVGLDCLEHILRRKSRCLIFLGLISQINDFHSFFAFLLHHFHLLRSPIYHRLHHLHRLHRLLHRLFHRLLHRILHNFCFFLLINRLFHKSLEFHASCWPMGHALFLENFVIHIDELSNRQLRHVFKVLETHDRLEKG